MTRLGVRAALVGGEWVEGDVDVVDGVVEAVGMGGSTAPIGMVAAPGFVDRQVNGFAGIDLRTATQTDYGSVAAALAEHGATAVLPTFYSSSPERYLDALGTLAEVHGAPPAGTRLGGAHLEGPFLSTAWAGAHDPRRLLAPDADLAAALLDAGPVALVTLAPELDGAHAVIDLLVERGVIVSMGHTDATADQARDGVAAGVSMITHCHNAHRRFAPRDPGPAGFALVDPAVTIGLICDGVHLAPETVLGVFAAAPDRVAVVTDAVAPAGSAQTTWALDGVELQVVGHQVLTADGRLAGSAVTPDASLRVLVGLGIEPSLALTAMATTPAAGLGLGRHDLTPGSVADVVVLDDRWEVRRTLVDGDEVWAAS